MPKWLEESKKRKAREKARKIWEAAHPPKPKKKKIKLPEGQSTLDKIREG
jgi:hypothetical protein